MKTNEIKERVRERYGKIAGSTGTSCCGGPVETDDGSTLYTPSAEETCCSSAPETALKADGYSMVGELYQGLEGHEQDADLGLGCGIPTRIAGIVPGETVVDLGSGAGNDAFVARAAVGETGRVIGVDFTQQMVEKAREIAARRGYGNVEFVQGDIEAMPLEDGIADLVISNCVLNLVPDKPAAFREMYRIIKPGGRFCISDIVIDGKLPPSVQASLEAYVGCVAGAMQRPDYLNALEATGFMDVRVEKEHSVDPPDSVLRGMFDTAVVEEYRASDASVTSVTVVGVRPVSTA